MSARRDELPNLAESQLEQEGLESFGINSLARAVAIKPPSIYKHFAGIEHIEHALIGCWFRRLAQRFEEVAGSQQAEAQQDEAQQAVAQIDGLVQAYRKNAAEAQQLYRLATQRPLNRILLAEIDADSEQAAMRAILELFDEDEQRHHRAWVAWAAIHGMISLEQAGRFPPDSDLAATWQELVAIF